MNHQIPTEFQNAESFSNITDVEHGRERHEVEDRRHDVFGQRALPPEDIAPPGQNSLRLTSAGRRLEMRANKLEMLLHPRHTRLRPPTSGSRIYSDAEIATATKMFHKLKHGEDRCPSAKSSLDSSAGPVDPLDRVADVLLDLFEL